MNVMKKLNQTQQLKVENVKRAIDRLQEAEEIIYSTLIDDLGGDSDWLYDYVFNCKLTDSSEYITRVKNEIFE
jgi:DNA polymerase II large subunit